MKSSVLWRALALVVVGLGLAVCVLVLLLRNETSREVTLQAAANFFGFVTTPFVLEATLALLGLAAVMTYNQWRLSKEGDGWVVLPEDKKEEE